jgi:hypothetical protein
VALHTIAAGAVNEAQDFTSPPIYNDSAPGGPS